MELELESLSYHKNNGPAGKPETETDPLPEYYHYQDEGCELATSCLNCPFARCIYEEPGGKQHFIKGLRDREILRLYTEGRGIKELAVMFDISQRTVQRALKRARNERRFHTGAAKES